MYTRKHPFAGIGMLTLFIALTLSASPSFCQNYHYKVANIAQCNILDSIVASHLQLSIKQADVDEMRFRVSVLNPTEHIATLSIRHGADLLFEDYIGHTGYDHIFNLNDLEDGVYVILISSGKEKITRNIRIRTNTKIDRQLTVE